jgi:hypothetical protein
MMKHTIFLACIFVRLLNAQTVVSVDATGKTVVLGTPGGPGQTRWQLGSPAGSGQGRWLFGVGYSDGVASSNNQIAQGPNGGTIHRFSVEGQLLISNLVFTIVGMTPGSTGLFGIFSADATTPLCLFNTFSGAMEGIISIAVNSGSNVVAGVCSLEAGGYSLIKTADLSGVAIDSLSGTSLTFAAMAQDSPLMNGFTSGTVSSGTGVNLVFAANLQKLLWVGFNSTTGSNRSIPLIWTHN